MPGALSGRLQRSHALQCQQGLAARCALQLQLQLQMRWEGASGHCARRMLRSIPMGRFLKVRQHPDGTCCRPARNTRLTLRCWQEMVNDLTPRLKGTGDEGRLADFQAYFKPKKIEADAHMVCAWDGGPRRLQGWAPGLGCA